MSYKCFLVCHYKHGIQFHLTYAVKKLQLTIFHYFVLKKPIGHNHYFYKYYAKLAYTHISALMVHI